MINHPRRSRAAKQKTKPRAVSTPANHEHDYSALLAGVRASFNTRARDARVLFLTNATDLNEIYLNSLPSHRQVHDCSCCRRFLETYGGLITVTDDGATVPVMWNPAGIPEFYYPAFAALQARVKKARITSIFLTKQTTWGNPVTGSWSHLSIEPPEALIYRERALTPGQAMAASKEKVRIVATALSEFTAPMLDEATRILEADALARSEKFISPVKWLRALHDRPKGRIGENMLWRAVALAPEGYCHPRSSVVGPLLESIAAGLPFDQIKAKFDAMMHPLRYQRPTAAPSAGNIKASEELVAKLGIAPSLERRFARLEDCHTAWVTKTPRDAEPAGAGVFGHLKPKDGSSVESVDMPAMTMTWDKFARTVLPNAEQMEIHVPPHGNFIALTTAANADAPPIMKWDREDERNAVAWYVYHGGSVASQWRLSAHTWAKINAIVPAPNLWGSRPMPFIAEGVVLVIDGAVDTRDNSGNALFPECLRDDLHAARSTIEAYSRSAKIGGREEASACGYHVGKGRVEGCLLRVRNSGAWNSYRIDRWD